ncbi:PadR family transcriptional regulator [Streptomyces sp. NPDC056519]|uniref:PadR family transcriptional regulator n=1 Tax=Streptomyces sp. NPDC056519 TaxID=3345849 RepID=UPI0036974DEF
MQEPTFLILTAMADGAKHGYGLIQEVSTITCGRVRLQTGTLYTTLDRLLRQGLVTVHSEEIVDGRKRRAYTLSGDGRSTLTAEAQRRRTTATEAPRRLGVSLTRPTGTFA